MAARKNQASKVADSIAALMDAMQDEVLPNVEELRREGWITAKDYADTVGLEPKTCKVRLDKLTNVEKKTARASHYKVTMYRMKK